MPEKRRGGPTVTLAVDVVRQARSSGNWVVALILVFALLAVVIGIVTQLVVPVLIYPAL